MIGFSDRQPQLYWANRGRARQQQTYRVNLLGGYLWHYLGPIIHTPGWFDIDQMD